MHLLTRVNNLNSITIWIYFSNVWYLARVYVCSLDKRSNGPFEVVLLFFFMITICKRIKSADLIELDVEYSPKKCSVEASWKSFFEIIKANHWHFYCIWMISRVKMFWINSEWLIWDFLAGKKWLPQTKWVKQKSS